MKFSISVGKKDRFGWLLVLKCDLPDHLRSFLENEFRYNVYAKGEYLKAYEGTALTQDESIVVAWNTAELISSQTPNLEKIRQELGEEIETFQIGNSDLELISKINSLFSYHEFSNVLNDYTLYSTYDNSFDKHRQLQIRFEITNVHICFHHSNSDFKLKIECLLASEEGVFEEQRFEVLAYSPAGFVKDTGNEDKIRCPHIVSNRLDVDAITAFLSQSLNHLKASSLDELKLKLSTFSTSFEVERLVSRPICAEPVWSFEHQSE